jgi:glycosyltransferase involved in cell wall biosynthesis
LTAEIALSVVLPVLNGQRWLSEALDSVAAQERSAHEVLVVDDGSVDGSRALASEREFVRILDGPGRGVVAAYQAGFDAVTGDAVVSIGQDDRFAAGAFAAFSQALAEAPWAGYASGRVQLFTDECEHFSGLRDDRLDRPFRARAPEAVVIRTDVIRRFPLRDSASVAWDVDLFLRFEDAGIAMTEIQELVAFKRLRPDSAIHEPGASSRAILGAVRASVERKRAAGR